MASTRYFIKIDLNANDVPGAKIDINQIKSNDNLQLKRWLECRGIKSSGKRTELLKRRRLEAGGYGLFTRDFKASHKRRTICQKWKCDKYNGQFKGSDLYFIRGKVDASMKKEHRIVHITISSISGAVLDASFTCPTSCLRRCNNVAALLLMLNKHCKV
ncbi:unnamed protein product [Mytilus coruscus]|uniref:SAP domain-containing protein n=1 Tax=Mytilus coruscus TaxID=42192 RepID=A0A6J8A5R5_MYTCO|nr:unnamed protein product [Mytilus coruscus]